MAPTNSIEMATERVPKTRHPKNVDCMHVCVTLPKHMWVRRFSLIVENPLEPTGPWSWKYNNIRCTWIIMMPVISCYLVSSNVQISPKRYISESVYAPRIYANCLVRIFCFDATHCINVKTDKCVCCVLCAVWIVYGLLDDVRAIGIPSIGRSPGNFRATANLGGRSWAKAFDAIIVIVMRIHQ